jgi:hypothetical protein
LAENAVRSQARLRHAQTALRTLGVEIHFAREGRMGARMIRICKSTEVLSGRPSVPSATAGVAVGPDLAIGPGRAPQTN